METPDRNPVTPEMIDSAKKEADELACKLTDLCARYTFPAIMSATISLMSVTIVHCLKCEEDMTIAAATACKHLLEAVARIKGKNIAKPDIPKDAN